jgi:hypothetical protein
MSDLGEYWKDVNDYYQAKRCSNTIHSTEILKRAGVQFESYNNGAHLIVSGKFDFWPSTGLFIDRITRKRNRGIHNLLRLCSGGSDVPQTTTKP